MARVSFASHSISVIHIGISGWRYAPWRGTFFPDDLPQRSELAFASARFSSIEINGTFYSLQRLSSFRAWAAETPDNFVFSVKAPRFITHLKRLKDVETPLANFFASGLLALGPKLGPILWQLPPNFRFDADRLEALFTSLPRSTRAAARLARKHDHRVREPWIKTDFDRKVRHALEVRHDSFVTPEFLALLQKHDVAVVVADTAGRWPLFNEPTTDFVYVRLHGDEELYASGYTPESLDRWAASLRRWTRTRSGSPRDAFVYFDNDIKTHAPFDAMALAQRLHVETPVAAADIAAGLTAPREPKKKRPARAAARRSPFARKRAA